MSMTDVVSDANIALKWFHDRGEEQVGDARGLLELHRSHRILLHVLDLTFYEVGNALLRGHAHATAEQTTTVLAALRQICPTITPDAKDLALAAELASEHDLTLYDAVYAATAKRRDAPFVSLDREVLRAGLGTSPARLLAQLAGGD
jgi:predicted nucleic acid-binding protein